MPTFPQFPERHSARVISFDELPEENNVLGEERPFEGLEAFFSSHFISYMVNTIL